MLTAAGLLHPIVKNMKQQVLRVSSVRIMRSRRYEDQSSSMTVDSFIPHHRTTSTRKSHQTRRDSSFLCRLTQRTIRAQNKALAMPSAGQVDAFQDQRQSRGFHFDALCIAVGKLEHTLLQALVP